VSEEIDEGLKRDVARALDGLLPEGRKLVVEQHGGRVRVTPFREKPGAPLAETHEKLYGQLMALNEEVSGAGCVTGGLLVLLAGLIAAAVHFKLFKLAFGWELEPLRSWWFYLALPTAAFIAGVALAMHTEGRLLRKKLPDLHEMLREAGIDRHTLLARIRGNAQLANLIRVLKRSKDFDEERGRRAYR